MNEKFYTITLPVEDEGFSSDERTILLLLESEQQATGKVIYFETEALLQDNQTSSFLLRAGKRFSVAVLPGIKVPLICLKDKGDDDVLDVQQVFDLVKNVLENTDAERLSKEMEERVIQVLHDSNGLSEELVRELLEACYHLVNYLKQDSISFVVEIGASFYDSEFLVLTKEVCKASEDAAFNPFTQIELTDNKTVNQKSCSDPLFVRLPLVQELQETSNMNLLLPKKFDVAQPYPYKEAYTPDYKDVKSGVPSSLFASIEGYANNNGTPLYENEKLFHQCILDWLQYTERNINGTELKLDVSSEEGKEMTSFQDEENAIGFSTVINQPAQEFLEALLGYFYRLHWSHNPNVPYSKDYDFEEDDDNEDNESDSQKEIKQDYINSDYSYRPAKTVSEDQLRFNALEILVQFLRGAALQCGCKVYADAIIQLARWQTRKPTALVIDGYSSMFMLGTGSIKTAKLNIADSAAISLGDGCVSKVTSLILEDGILKDRSIFGDTEIWRIPVGLTTTVTFKEHNSDKTAEAVTYYSAIDFVREVVLNKKKFKGVVFEDGKFKDAGAETNRVLVSHLIRQYKGNSNDFLMEPFYVSPQMQTFYVDYSAQGSSYTSERTNILALMSERATSGSLSERIKENAFTTVEDLTAKVRSHEILSKSTAVDFAIIETLIPVYLKADEKFSEFDERTASVADVLNCWLEAIIECGFEDEYGTHPAKCEVASIRDALGLPPVKKQEPVQQSVQQSVQQPVQQPTEQAVQQSAQTVGAPDVTIFRIPKADAIYYPLITVDPASNEKVVRAYLASERVERPGLKPKHIYTVVSKEFVEGNSFAHVEQQTYVLKVALTSYLLKDLRSMAMHKQDGINLFFENMNIFDVLLNALANRVR